MPAEPTTPDQRRPQYLSEPVQVALAVQRCLLSAWPEPMTASDLLRLLSEDQRLGAPPSRDQIYRALSNLAYQGCADQSARGWLPGAELTAAAERLRQRIAQLVHHYLPRE